MLKTVLAIDIAQVTPNILLAIKYLQFNIQELNGFIKVTQKKKQHFVNTKAFLWIQVDLSGVVHDMN